MDAGILSISQAFQHGGMWMWAILMAQIVSLAIVAERIFQLYLARSPIERELSLRFEKPIKSGQLKKVITAKAPIGRNHPIFQVAQIGAQAASQFGGSEEIQARMDEVLLHENEKVGRLTGFLAVIGNVGTLLGLLGTIIGLIKAFSAVANLNPIEKSVQLTNGISMAMNTTAYGLIVAIPALVMYAVFQNRAHRLNEDLNQAALRVYNWLRFSVETVPRKSRSAK